MTKTTKPAAAKTTVARSKAKEAELAATAPAKAAKARATKAEKVAAKNPDTIAVYKKANSNPHNTDILVQSAGGQKVIFDQGRITKQLKELLNVGKSFAAVEAYLAEHKGKPALAKGVDQRNAPHSSKAVQDDRSSNGATAKAARATTKAEPKAPRAKAEDTTKLTVLVKAKDAGLKAGSDRFLRLAAIEGCKTLGEALATTIPGGKRVAMDNIRGMEKRGHVKLG